MKLVALVPIKEDATVVSDFPEAYANDDAVRTLEISDYMYDKYWAAREAYVDAVRQIELEWMRRR